MSRLLQWFSRPSANRSGRARVRRPQAYRLRVELLETREVPSTVSAVSWQSGGVDHHALFALGADNGVYVSTNGGGFVGLGGYALEVSAGLDAFGNPQVFAIGADHGLYVSAIGGGGFTGLGGYVKQISAASNGLVFAIGGDDSVFVHDGTVFTGLGGYALEISAGLDAAGNPQVFAIGANHGLFVSAAGGGGFTDLGGYVKQISGSVNNLVFAIGQDNSVFFHDGTGFTGLGGYALEISAGLDAFGGPQVFAIGADNGLYVNGGSGFTGLGGYVLRISAPRFAVGFAGDLAYAVGMDHGGFLHQAGFTGLGGYLQ